MRVGLLPERVVIRGQTRRHGTRSCYGSGCRCDLCKAINALWQRRYNRARPTRQRVRDQPKDRARRRVATALANGSLSVSRCCSQCGMTPRPDADGRRTLDAHHDDYSKPLDVRWLCRACHVLTHRKQRALDGSEATTVGEKTGDELRDDEPRDAAASLPSSAGEQLRLVA